MKENNNLGKLVPPLIKIEFYDGSMWQTLASESYINLQALQIAWDLLNDNTEVIWQQL